MRQTREPYPFTNERPVQALRYVFESNGEGYGRKRRAQMHPMKQRTVRIGRAALILMVCVTLQLAATAHAQLVTGTIIGTVTDESGAVLPGVTATIESPALPGGPQSGVTDGQGRYR